MLRQHFYIGNLPADEGVFGPEIVVDVQSGDAALRLDDGTIVGTHSGASSTNAFSVWVGQVVLVVSEGVTEAAFAHVAGGIRKTLGTDKLPIAFTHASGADRTSAAATSDVTVPIADRELARAVAYVMVQCAWNEGPTLHVRMNGQAFIFRLEFKEVGPSQYVPVVSPVDSGVPPGS